MKTPKQSKHGAIIGRPKGRPTKGRARRVYMGVRISPEAFAEVHRFALASGGTLGDYLTALFTPTRDEGITENKTIPSEGITEKTP